MGGLFLSSCLHTQICVCLQVGLYLGLVLEVLTYVERDRRAVSEVRSQITTTHSPHQHHALEVVQTIHHSDTSPLFEQGYLQSIAGMRNTGLSIERVRQLTGHICCSR